jgi:topoisomerase-4 subunit A
MKDEDEDNIPNEDKSNEDTNDSNESIDEGFEDIVTLKESISMIITKVK